MPKTDKRVDQYILNSEDFAKPILEHLRKLVHDACPDAEETIKWQFPHFDYKGMMCSMAGFKQHCSFGFWKQSVMENSKQLKENRIEGGMGSFGKIKSLADLPPDETMLAYIREACRLNDENIKVPRETNTKPQKLVVPKTLSESLAQNEKANETFTNFSLSCKREYVEWITEAKTETTRDKRIAQTIEWLAEGKRRNWKYEKC